MIIDLPYTKNVKIVRILSVIFRLKKCFIWKEKKLAILFIVFYKCSKDIINNFAVKYFLPFIILFIVNIITNSYDKYPIMWLRQK